jgi:hypothetical protein
MATGAYLSEAGARANRRLKLSATRAAVLPSQSGIEGALAMGFANNDSTSLTAVSTLVSRFVPSVTVTGRSVLSRNVRHGTPR